MGAGASGVASLKQKKYLMTEDDEETKLESRSMRLPREREAARRRKAHTDQYISSTAKKAEPEAEKNDSESSLVTIQRIAAAHHIRKVTLALNAAII